MILIPFLKYTHVIRGGVEGKGKGAVAPVKKLWGLSPLKLSIAGMESLA